MSWGERSCIFKNKCPMDNRSCSTCNVDCRSYKHDGKTKPDSKSRGLNTRPNKLYLAMFR